MSIWSVKHPRMALARAFDTCLSGTEPKSEQMLQTTGKSQRDVLPVRISRAGNVGLSEKPDRTVPRRFVGAWSRKALGPIGRSAELDETGVIHASAQLKQQGHQGSD